MWARRPEQLPEVLSSMDEACIAEGRDPASLVRTVGIVVLEQPDLTAEGPRAPSTVPLADTDTWIETLRGYAAAGVAHVQVVFEPMCIAALETFAPVVDGAPGRLTSRQRAAAPTGAPDIVGSWRWMSSRSTCPPTDIRRVQLTEAELSGVAAAAIGALADPSRRCPGLRHNREFRIVLLGQAVSAFGDAISLTVLPLLVVALTGSGIAMGIVGVLQLLPDLLLGLPAGALADRWDRRRMIIVADLGRALLTALIPLSVLLGWPTMGVILLVTFPINALRVRVPGRLDRGHAVHRGVDQVGRASGYRGGHLQRLVRHRPGHRGPAGRGPGSGPHARPRRRVVRGLGGQPDAHPAAAAGGPATASRPHLLADIREGIAYIVGEPVLRVVIPFWTIISVATAPIVPVVIFFLTIDRAEGPGHGRARS